MKPYKWDIYFTYTDDITGPRAFTGIYSDYKSINTELLKEINLMLDRIIDHAKYRIVHLSLAE